MTVQRPRAADREDPQAALAIIGRGCFGAASVAAGISGLVFAATAIDLAPAVYGSLLAALAGFALLSGAGWLYGARASFPLSAGLLAMAVAAMLIAGAMGAALGDGMRDPALGVCALAVCMVTAVLGWRTGVALAALALVETLALGWLEVERSGAAALVAGRVPLMLALQWIVLACALVAGTLMARVVMRYLEAAQRRAGHFSDLLKLAVDWYWELDRDFRFSFVSPAGAHIDPDSAQQRIGLTPWEIPEVSISEAALDEHRADLEAHRPFSGMLTRRRDKNGRSRIHSISGEPKFDADGAFDGYWGVARDVTEEIRAQRGMAASETRYRELFERSPSPLVLHRNGVIFDANPAAADLFGFVDTSAMYGVKAADLYAPGEQRRRATELVDQLDRMRVGEGIPVSDMSAVTADGRSISVQATAVRVDTAVGTARLPSRRCGARRRCCGTCSRPAPTASRCPSSRAAA